MLWRHMGEWRYSSTILDLSTRWWWVVSFTPRSLYRLRILPRFRLDKRLGGPQSRSGRYREESNLAPCPESNPGRPARRCNDWGMPTPEGLYYHILIKWQVTVACIPAVMWCSGSGSPKQRAGVGGRCRLSRGKSTAVGTCRLITQPSGVFHWAFFSLLCGTVHILWFTFPCAVRI
jgi:hypothetical protein